MLWCCSNRLAMRMTWRFDLSLIRQHKKIDHVKVATAYKRKAQKIQSVNSSESNDSISEDLINWKQILLTQIKLNMTEMKSEKYDHWLFLKFFKIAREFRLTSKRAKRMICNDALTLQEKNLLLKMLFNREATMIWDFSKMRKIKDIVSSSQQIRTISHDAWQTLNFSVSKTLHQIIIDMLKNQIKHDILKSCHDLYRNLWFLIRKKFNQYHMINAAMNAQLNFIYLCSVTIVVEEDMSILKDLYLEHFKKIAHYLIFLSRSFKISTKEFWKFKHEALKFMIQDKYLFKRFNKTASVRRMMNLQEERSNILQKLHDESDHHERERTYEKMIDRYWWKKIWKNTCTYVKFCEECQLQASRRKKKTLHSIWILKVVRIVPRWYNQWRSELIVLDL